MCSMSIVQLYCIFVASVWEHFYHKFQQPFFYISLIQKLMKLTTCFSLVQPSFARWLLPALCLKTLAMSLACCSRDPAPGPTKIMNFFLLDVQLAPSYISVFVLILPGRATATLVLFVKNGRTNKWKNK